MKKAFAICLLIFNGLFVSSQTDSVHVYSWDELANVNPDTIYGISLAKLKLDSVPNDLAKFVNLKYLDLSKNKLTELPDFIGDLESIEEIDLSRNHFSIFPVELCRLLKLKKLILNRNSIDKLPECTGYLTELEYIDLWETPIMSFPNSISNLKNLKTIDLQGIKYGPIFQEDFRKQLPWVTIKFDPPCDCMK